MTRSATMALEQISEEGIIEESVEVQDSREPAPRHPATAPSDAPASEPLGSLMSFMPSIADQFMLSAESATRKLADRVDGSQSLNPDEIKAAKESFIGAMLEAAGQLMSQREWLVDEIRSFDGLWQGKVLNKIREVEAVVEAEELRIRSMTDDDSVDLSSVMRSISTLNEKKAYLEGLKFQMQCSTD
jgi:hypothetical protein